MTEPSKEELFAKMPHVSVRGDDGSERRWWCQDGVWVWEHVDAEGNLMNFGYGAP